MVASYPGRGYGTLRGADFQAIIEFARLG